MDKRWQDAVNIILGAWLFISPWVFGFYDSNTAASWNFYIVGIAVIVFAIVAMRRGVGLEWINFVLGVWMVVSPWLVGYSGAAAARDDAVIVGIVTAVLACWAYFSPRHGGTHATTH